MLEPEDHVTPQSDLDDPPKRALTLASCLLAFCPVPYVPFFTV